MKYPTKRLSGEWVFGRLFGDQGLHATISFLLAILFSAHSYSQGAPELRLFDNFTLSTGNAINPDRTIDRSKTVSESLSQPEIGKLLEIERVLFKMRDRKFKPKRDLDQLQERYEAIREHPEFFRGKNRSVFPDEVLDLPVELVESLTDPPGEFCQNSPGCQRIALSRPGDFYHESQIATYVPTLAGVGRRCEVTVERNGENKAKCFLKVLLYERALELPSDYLAVVLLQILLNWNQRLSFFENYELQEGEIGTVPKTFEKQRQKDSTVNRESQERDSALIGGLLTFAFLELEGIPRKDGKLYWKIGRGDFDRFTSNGSLSIEDTWNAFRRSVSRSSR